MEKISIIIPLYNEESAIEKVIDDINIVMEKMGADYEIIAVDDGSTDRTSELIKDKKNVKLIRHQRNKGVGRARKTGIRAAKGELIVMIDGDGTYPDKSIPDLVKRMEHADMVIGSRKNEKGTLKFLRKPIKYFIRKFASFIAGEDIPDLNSGLRVFRKKDAVKFFNILPDTHSFVSTITLCFLCNEYTVDYAPIEYYKRKGNSTFHPLKDTFAYISLIITSILFFKPLKFFFPVSLCIFAWCGVRVISHTKGAGHLRMTEGDIMLFLSSLIIITLGLLADMIGKENKHRYLK